MEEFVVLSSTTWKIERCPFKFYTEIEKAMMKEELNLRPVSFTTVSQIVIARVSNDFFLKHEAIFKESGFELEFAHA